MRSNDWMRDPKLKGISPEKLNLLTALLSQANGKSQNELIPFFLAATQKANAQGVSFNENETDMILNVLKQNMSKEEQEKIDTIRRLSTFMVGKGKK